LEAREGEKREGIVGRLEGMEGREGSRKGKENGIGKRGIQKGIGGGRREEEGGGRREEGEKRREGVGGRGGD
jgi:hypothetical protein